MSSIDEHVLHFGKGKARTTRCNHCNKILTSRSKDRWRQHMRSCDILPSEFRHYFSGYEHSPYSRPALSKAASEEISKPSSSPVPSIKPKIAPSSRATSAPNVTSANVTRTASSVTSTDSSPSPHAENSLLRAADVMIDTVATSATADFLSHSPHEITEILLIHGPCSFIRGSWTGGDATKANVLREVQNLAVEKQVSMVTHESNHEGTILDLMLNAKENEIIVLCWVGRLSDSPTILRALELTKNRVIVVSPKGVDHGNLPNTVVGVLSGFGQLSQQKKSTPYRQLISYLVFLSS